MQNPGLPGIAVLPFVNLSGDRQQEYFSDGITDDLIISLSRFPDFLVIARTDARAVEGLEQALQRGRMYREAGADALFIEALTSEAEAEEAVRAFPGVPLLFNWAEGGKTPPISLDRLRELGYRIVIFPLSTLLAATGAMRRILLQIAQAGTPAAAIREFPTFTEFVDLIGLPQVQQAEQRYAVKPAETGSESGGKDGSDV